MGSHKETKDLKKKNKRNKNPKLFENNEKVNEVEEKHEKSRPTEKKKSKSEKGNNVDADKALQISIEDNSNKATREKRKNKSKNNKRKSEEQSNVVVGKFDQTSNYAEDSHDEQNDEMVNKVEEENEKCRPTEKKKRKREKGNNVDTGKALQISIEDNSNKLTGEKKKNKLRKKKRKSEDQSNAVVGKFDQTGNNAEDGHDEQNDDREADQSLFETQGEINNCKEHVGADNGIKIRTRKSKKSKKKKRKDHDNLEGERSSDQRSEADQDEVYHISSGDEDCSKGMKRWITEYHQSRPGLKVLQQRIDEFITDHEAKLEEERKEREARVAEGGWTVVTHQKGRKKTTDSESGITVGSVAQAAVDDNMAKKKRKGVGLDFYRFQRREAQRNEILSLQSKFEQDKKRIQQLRAARKFQPY